MPANARIFGSGVYLLVDECQKAAIVTTIDSVPFFAVLVGSWVVLSVLFGTAALWIGQSASHTDLLIGSSVLVALYGALLISRSMLSSRLRPIIAGLPTTDERITKDDIRSKTSPVVLSSTRLSILKICFILMPFILVSLVISRAVDMHQETRQPMLEALYLANANFGGMIIMLTAGAFLYGGLLFIVASGQGKRYPDRANVVPSNGHSFTLELGAPKCQG